MGRLFCERLKSHAYCCANCGCQIAQCEELVSTQFHCKNGRAYLFHYVANVRLGPREERLMTTGPHIVRNTFCSQCMYLVGWKYEEARCMNQKYKEGKYILERSKMIAGEMEESEDEGDD
ncbi:hypothetical protein BSKO_01594 [Bryopsis sp. KO-2023]|nr:hypothetical protein BSKO_01594 [Bryopsis sp. KO-2023]